LRTRKKSVFRRIFGASPEGMILIDSTGLCLSANSAAVRTLFTQPTNVRGLWVQDLLAPLQTAPKNISFVKLLSESGKTRDHFQLLNAGNIRQVEIHYRFNVSHGKHLIFLKDASDSIHSEALIRKQARLLDLADDTIMVRDLNDIIVYWNQGAERLYGWSREEAVGQYVHSFLQTVFPEDFQSLRERFLRLGTWSGILIHTVKSGAQVIVHSRWTLEKDDMGKPAAYLEINNNITEKKRAEEALQRAYDELEARVSERTAELSQANLLLQKEIQEHKDTEEALRNSEIELRALSSRLWNAQEEERRKISRELHDDLGQILTAIELDLQRTIKSREAVKRNALLQQLLQKSSEARGRIKEISSLLRPGILDDLGIREAIEHNVSEFMAQTGI
jgi:PAS domain S-box-containing protein